MCRGLNVKNTYLEACGDEGNVVVGGRKIGFIDLRWSETKLREGVGGRNASKNAVARFDLPASLIYTHLIVLPYASNVKLISIFLEPLPISIKCFPQLLHLIFSLFQF